MEAATRRRKHWGWGYEDQQPDRAALEATAKAIHERLGFEVEEIEEPVPLDEISLREPRLKPPKRFAEMFSAERHDRVSHSLGKAYRDVVRGFRGQFDNPPDLVAYPESVEDVDIVLSFAADAGAAAIPFGGGTSVVGGVEPRVGEDYKGSVSIDLTRMDRVLEVDAVSHAARIQAGALGPVLEEQLREHGLTLRHFPQSFEYSTLGGWIATRAGGHFATLYTHIDDLVESVRAVTPAGEHDWSSFRLPGSGAGPSPDRMLLGSEGILGVIVDAWMRVQERPRWQAPRAASPSRTSPRAPRPSGRSPSRGSIPATAGCSIPRSPPSPAPARPARRCWCWASSPLTIRSTSRCAWPWTWPASTGASPTRSGLAAPRMPSASATIPARRPAAARRRSRRPGRTRSARGATPSSSPPTCATLWSPAACSPTPSRPRSPGTASPTSTPR